MDSNFLGTISRYMQFQGMKFVGGLWLFYLIFQKLNIDNYASYGVVQSITMLSSLLLGFNIHSSFQKLYSKKLIVKSVNLVILVILFASAIFYTLVFWGLSWAGMRNMIFSNSQHAPNAVLFYFYSFSFGVIVISSSMLNAMRKTFLYGLTTTLPVLISIVALIVIDVGDINTLILILACSNFIVLVPVLLGNLSIFSMESYSSKRTSMIFRYIVGYTWLSIPTLSSKYSLDVVARSILLTSKGELAVAVLTFSTSLFAVFRSVEQGFFRAITPFLLLNDNDKSQKVSLTKKLILLQSIFTVTFFILSPYWLEILKVIFSSKPESVFVPLVLIVMACTTVISYIKNYYLSKAKKHSASVRRLFVIATVVNLSMLLSISIIDLSTIKFVLIQLIFATLNLSLIKLLIKF